ncbi:CYTH domain-containing protein [Rubellicoccus peritrichatus]|uniref:CYTH domain-containing protein n=1 Tax=Rubellicoccus peritrichatus TaxID=3080537 RepID=A0AAQ3LJI6_9BACT|nr:CYTH domain-containing protein [Puniceicoccus sp. CR14]WOO43369.1 CYTH domain-containing protein [Puniceicoccus sp. CR14]
MPKEIERKFIVDTTQLPKLSNGDHYTQGYIDPERATMRVRITPKGCVLTFKSKEGGTTRSEYEFPVDEATGRALLEDLGRKPFIDKTRVRHDVDGKTWEIDTFYGDNEGLVMAEVELDSEDETITIPEWAVKEVTNDARYYNANLSQRPYSTFAKERTSQ